MTCYTPRQAWRHVDPSHAKLIFDKNSEYRCDPLKIACRKCIGCRLAYSRAWAVRCVHEASLYEHNSFITLTFSDEYLPRDGSIHPRDFQLFMKRLRKHFEPRKIRYFHCGEYGEKFSRPHYHACLFNLDFDDKYYWKTVNGCKYFVSPTLNRIWGAGYCILGNVTFDSAAYVARYITKKMTGEKYKDHYVEICKDTGLIYDKHPEYTTMSRRPGIAKEWFEIYKNDVFPHDEVVVYKGNGESPIIIPPPKFYDNQYELLYPEEFKILKEKRLAKALALEVELTKDLVTQKFKDKFLRDRLNVRHKCKLKSVQRLVRNYEKECV